MRAIVLLLLVLTLSGCAVVTGPEGDVRGMYVLPPPVVVAPYTTVMPYRYEYESPLRYRSQTTWYHFTFKRRDRDDYGGRRREHHHRHSW